jgi:DNA topoisomerase-1
MKLAIVETPAQAKSLTQVLGDGWHVESCSGFVRDLPSDRLGIDVDNEFHPTFALVPGNGNYVRRLMKAIRESEAVYIATPPTIAGEATAWNALALSPDTDDKLIYRVMLPALTPDTIRAAFSAPRPLDMRLVEAEVTERIINRLISWSISAIGQKTVGVKKSLTYHGMIALRLLAEREAEIAAHIPATRRHVSIYFEHDGVPFIAQVLNAKGARLTLRNAEQAAQLETLLKQGMFWVDKAEHVIEPQSVPTPLTLSDLIETTHRELGLTSERTLSLLHTLYEAGWITYPGSRPSHHVSEAAAAFIRHRFGAEYLAADAPVTAEIAPADVNREPEYLPGDGTALYALIWLDFIAAHMPAAQKRIMSARVLVGATKGKPYPLELRATAKMLYFDGWHRLVPTLDEDEVLPFLPEGTALRPKAITMEAVSNKRPAYFTEGLLVRALMSLGISAPAAAHVIEQLQTASYATVEGDRLMLTEAGRTAANDLTASFDDLTSPNYAAEIYAEIAGIAAGERSRLDVLDTFWSRFGATLRPAVPSSPRIVGEHKPVVLHLVEEA